MDTRLEALFTKKPRVYADEAPGMALSWEVWVPLLTNPVFVGDALVLFALLWIAPSALCSIAMIFMGVTVNHIVFTVSWIAMCVIVLALTCLFFASIRLRNGFYARYTLNSTGISCEISHEIPLSVKIPSGRFMAWRAISMPQNSVTLVKNEKWIMWNKIKRVKGSRFFRVVTLSDGFLPIFRLFCPDNATFDRAQDICRAILEMKN